MTARQADQREQLYAVDVSTLGLRQVKCMSLGTRSDGKKMKTLLFDDGSSLAVVASPLPKGARNLADCVDRNDPDHEDLLKEHMLWRLAESWCPEDQTVPTATELAEVRELTPAVTACIPFCYRFLHILAAHMNGCKAEHVTTRVVVDVAEQMFANADHQMLQHGYEWKLMSPGIIRGGNAIARRVLYWSSHGHVC